MTENIETTPTADIFQLAYVSSAVEPFSDAELEELLKKSRRNNESVGITGMLLYREGNFMQCLEGPKDAVLQSMARINDDPRHRGVIVLFQDKQPERDFADWSMGFKKLESSTDELEGYSDFLSGSHTSEDVKGRSAKSLRLLRSFRKNMR